MADMLKNPIDLSEVQDFSMSKKQGGTSSFAGKGKLDDMLTKLMKKNNCVSYDAHHIIEEFSIDCSVYSPLKNQHQVVKKNVDVNWTKSLWDCQPPKNKRHSLIHLYLRQRSNKLRPAFRSLQLVLRHRLRISRRTRNRLLLQLLVYLVRKYCHGFQCQCYNTFLKLF